MAASADIVDLVVVLVRGLRFRGGSLFCGVLPQDRAGHRRRFLGAVMPARDMRLALLEALRASSGSAPPRVGTRLVPRSDRAI